MPFAGADPKLTDKIDRCVIELTERGRSKSSAIAICRSSIEREKANFGAKRGERISGSLFRGQGGQFSSGGNGGEDKPLTRRDRIALTQIQNGIKLKPARMAELKKAGFITDAGKLTPKGLKAIGKKKPTATTGGKKKPKKGGGGGGKGDKKRQAVQKQVDTLNDAEKRVFRLFASGDLDKLPARLQAKFERLGFVSKAGKLTATGRIAFDILGKDKKKAHTTKSKQDAIDKANYRSIGEKSTQVCTTCRFNNAGNCTLFKFKFDRDHICDRWRPNIKALRERAQVLRGEEQREQVPTKKAHTLKRSRGPKEQRAMFAKMGASGSLQGKGADGKRTGGAGNVGAGASKLDNEINSFLDGLNTGGNNVEDSILPKGKAPRGEGKEFATRKWIHSRMETMKSRRDRLEGIVGRNRGTRRGRREATAAKIKLDALNEAIKMGRHMITSLKDAGIPFSDGRDIFSDIFSYTTATTGGIR